LAGLVAMVVTVMAIGLSFVPSPGETTWIFETKLVLGTIGFIGVGLILYYRGWSAKRREARLQAAG
jgi:hypothetical protein